MPFITRLLFPANLGSDVSEPDRRRAPRSTGRPAPVGTGVESTGSSVNSSGKSISKSTQEQLKNTKTYYIVLLILKSYCVNRFSIILYFQQSTRTRMNYGTYPLKRSSHGEIPGTNELHHVFHLGHSRKFRLAIDCLYAP